MKDTYEVKQPLNAIYGMYILENDEQQEELCIRQYLWHMSQYYKQCCSYVDTDNIVKYKSIVDMCPHQMYPPFKIKVGKHNDTHQ